MRFFTHFFVFLLGVCLIQDGYSQGNCAQAQNFGVINSTSLNCGGDVVTRRILANSSFWNTASDNIDVLINWGDGTPTEVFDLTFDAGFASWTVLASHTYMDNGPQCVYNANATLIVNGTTCPQSDLNSPFNVTVYDELDNTNLGTHEIDHDPTSAGALNTTTQEVDVCQGTTDAIRLQDMSDFNCTQPQWASPPQTTDARNDRDRWIQWVYGTTEDITGNVIIDGVIVTTFPYYGPVQHISVGTPFPPNETTLDIQMPITAQTGESFVVTLRSWNICNPYDDNTFDANSLNPVGGVFDVGVEPVFGVFPEASEAPVEITQLIRIIDSPAPPNPVSLEVCEGDVLTGIDFQINNTAGSTTINWYDGDPEAGGDLITNPNGTNSTTFPAADHPMGDISSNEGDYSLWASYILGGTNSCESPAVESIITVRNSLTVPDIDFDTGTDPVCAGTDGLVFSLPNIASTETHGGTTEYVWSVTSGLSIDGSNNGQSLTVDVNPGASGTQAVSVIRRYPSNPQCASAIETYNITVDALTVAGSLSGTKSICEDETTGTLELTGYTGSVVEWQRSFNGSGFTSIGNAGNTTFSEQLSTAGSYEYQVVVQNGVCSQETTNVITITVNDKPSVASIAGDATICQGDNATLMLAVTNGTAPYDITIDHGIGTFEWSGSSDNPVVAPLSTTTYTITSVVDANGCQPSSITGSVTITIGNPTDAVLVGDASICNGDNTDLAVNITGGTAPFTINITPDLGTIGSYTSGDQINTGALTSSTVYTLNSVVDANGCPVLGISDDEANINVGVPLTAATLNVTDVCAGEDVMFSVDITGGTPSYILTYELNGVQTIVTSYTEGSDINLGALSTANYTLEIFSIEDQCGGIINNPDTEFFTVNTLPAAISQSAELCSEMAGGNTATVNLAFLENAIDEGAGHTIQWYKQNSPLSDFIAAPASYEVTDGVTIYAEVSDGTCTAIADVAYTVNPTPPDAANPQDGISCSSDLTGTIVSVDDPGAGYSVKWFQDALGATSAVGTFNGANDQEFIPSANTDFTYYAFVQDEATNCISLNGVAVQHTVDIAPTAPDGGADAETCSDSYQLNAVPADNGGTGFWTSGGMLYFENFQNLPNGTQNDNGQFGWTTDISGLDPSYALPPGFFEVRDGRFTSRNLGDATGVAVWRSEAIDISSIDNVSISLTLYKEGRLETEDYMEAYYFLDGTPVKFGQINRTANDPTSSSVEALAEVLTLNVGGVGTLEIEIRIASESNDEVQGFDNLVVRESAGYGNITFDNIFDAQTTVRGLQDGINSVYWNISSDLGACSLMPDEVVITKIEAPEGEEITATFCEEDYNSGEVTGVDLTTYNNSVIGSANPADRDVEWFIDPGRSVPVSNPSSIDIEEGDIFYALITEPSSGAGCVNDFSQPGSITFTVNTLPQTKNQHSLNNSAETVFCESGFDTGVADDINLSVLEDDITYNHTFSVSWLSPTFSSITDPANVDGVEDGDIFYAVVSNTITGCTDTAEVEFTIHSNPLVNPIWTSSGSAEPTLTVCRSNDIILLQVDQSLNSNTIYTWNIPDTPGEAIHFGGGATNFFVLLQFPNASPGMVLEVTETNVITGCTGPVNQLTIVVDDSSEKPVIDGPVEVCKDQQNVVYEVSNAQSGSIYNWTVPTGLGSIISGQGTAQIEVHIASSSGNISVEETSSSGCSRPPSDPFSVTVDSGPSMISSDALNLCSGELVEDHLEFNADIPSTYSWIVLSKAASIGGATTGDMGIGNINHLLTNTSTADAVIIYQVTPENGSGCVGTYQIITVTVNPEPFGIDESITICSNSVIAYDLQNKIEEDGNELASTFVWRVVTDNSDIQGESLIDQTGEIINDTLINNSASDQLVTYLVTPTGIDKGCEGEPFEITVNVHPEPVGLTDNISLCSGELINYDLEENLNLGNGISSSFTWVATDNFSVTGESILPKTGNIITDAIENKTTIAQVVTYTVVPVDNNNDCSGQSFTINVTVEPEPLIDPVLGSVTVCSNVESDIVLNTISSSIEATDYDITLVSQGLGLSGIPTTGTGLDTEALIDEIFINNTSGPLEVVYEIIPNNGSCKGEAFYLTLIVHPEPVLDNDLEIEICSSEPSGIVLATIPTSSSATSFRVDNISFPTGLTADAGNIVLGESGDENLIGEDSYSNSTNSPLIVEYEITPINGSCEGASDIISLVINPTPVLADDLSSTPICSGETAEINLSVTTGSVGAVSYDINEIIPAEGLDARVGNASPGLGQPADAIFDDVFTNISSSPKAVKYLVAPVSENGCNGEIEEISLIINPSPKLNEASAILCSGEETGIKLTTSIQSEPAVSFEIRDIRMASGLNANENNTSEGSSSQSDVIAGDVFDNFTEEPLSVQYDIIPFSSSGCEGAMITAILTVEPAISVTPDVLSYSICNNELTSIELTSPINVTSGNISFNYTAADTAGFITGYSPSRSNLPEGFIIDDQLVNSDTVPHSVIYTITPVASGAKNGEGCSGESEVVIITVEPRPELFVTNHKQVICNGESTSIELSTPTGPSFGSIEFRLDTIIFSGALSGFTTIGTLFSEGDTIKDAIVNPETGPVTITYRLRPIIPDGSGVSCEGAYKDVQVIVNPITTVTAGETEFTICSGDFINISFSETRNISNTFFRWVVVPNDSLEGELDGFGNTLFQSLVNTSSKRQSLDYVVTPEINGCTGIPEFIEVHVDPIPDIGMDNSMVTICEGETLRIELTGDVENTSFEWTATSSNSNISGFNSGLGGMGDFVEDTIYNSGNSPGTITYTIIPTGPEPTICQGTPQVLIVNVGPRITGGFLTEDIIKCHDSSPSIVSMQFSGIPPFDVVLNDGVDDISLTGISNYHVMQLSPSVTTTYKLISVTDANGCSAVETNQEDFDREIAITISEVSADFEVANSEGCSPLTVSFTYNQVKDVTYTWSWFDGSPDSMYTASEDIEEKIIFHTFQNFSSTNNLDLDVRLLARLPAEAGGCIDTQTKNIVVYPVIQTNVIPQGSTIICSGAEISFRNFSQGASVHRWFYRRAGVNEEIDVKTESDFIRYTFENTSTDNPLLYEFVYQAGNNNCMKELIIPITVYQGGIPSFEITGQSEFIGGAATLQLNNTSIPLNEDNFIYSWNFGEDATPGTFIGATAPEIDYISPGQKTITLTVTNKIANEEAGLTCSYVYSEEINIIVPDLIADFSLDPMVGCAPVTINITENRATGDQFIWEVKDVNGKVILTSNEAAPSFIITKPGTYEVKLETILSQTGQSEVASIGGINVYRHPVASFDVRPKTVYMPDPVFTFNYTEDADSYIWKFGDGSTSEDFEPTHVYTAEGIYDITLIVETEYEPGITCADSTTLSITAAEGGESIIPNAFTPDTRGPSGDGRIRNEENNDIFLPLTEGVEEFHMLIFDRWGNMIFESNDQTVGWDGYDVNGKLLPAGVYVYQLKLRLSNGKRSQILGDVTLIK